jgi:hypothetical protein
MKIPKISTVFIIKEDLNGSYHHGEKLVSRDEYDFSPEETSGIETVDIGDIEAFGLPKQIIERLHGLIGAQWLLAAKVFSQYMEYKRKPVATIADFEEFKNHNKDVLKILLSNNNRDLKGIRSAEDWEEVLATTKDIADLRRGSISI